ncbi:putative aspartic proteinase nepenthesin I [Carex littledalei]|uniref:Putative aspartic proteinase nepenthesin I n=1 Tax=Carex littledalei TaxID=544730 RepID=A0A833RL47_9POAL|nr:putative aspartic proteinase nepenthesin I [Carex littledalei]
MATARLVPVLIFLVFLSFRPTFSGPIPGGTIEMITPKVKSFFKGVKSGMKWYDRKEKVEDLFEILGVVTPSDESERSLGVVTYSNESEKALSLDDIDEGMFAFKFGVGVPPQQVTGLLSISSLLTWISGYQLSRNVGCCAFKKDNHHICCAECGATCQSYKGYDLVSDRFTFSNIGYLDSYFAGSPMGANNSAGPMGIISFSLSSYSVVSNLQTKQFSYFFSYNSTKNSSILLGDNVSSIPRTGLQAAQLIGYQNYYTHLYFVNLTQISFGNKYVAIPQTDFDDGVILDTIIPVTLLAQSAYKKLKSEIMAQIGQPVANPSNSFDMCYGNSTHWPNLTLSFSGPSGYAQMVLRKENYVVTDDDAGLECVAIFPTPSQGFSVIGSMAQLDRQMIFDVKQSTLYFDQYPDIVLSSDTVSSSDTAFSSDTKPTIALNLVVVYFIILLLCC